MNYKKIIENGYGKLAEKLPAEDKAYLKGYKQAIEDLKTFKDNIGDFINNDIKTLAKIQTEIAECTVDSAVEWLDSEHDGILISCVDHNHYSIDANGNIVDDEVGKNE